MKALWKLLGALAQARAATKGPGAWVGNRARAKAHKTLASLMRPKKRGRK